MQQAIAIQKKLAFEPPVEFNSDFVYFLHDLAILLSDMDHPREAPDAI
jgi:hypothetical protein